VCHDWVLVCPGYSQEPYFYSATAPANIKPAILITETFPGFQWQEVFNQLGYTPKEEEDDTLPLPGQDRTPVAGDHATPLKESPQQLASRPAESPQSQGLTPPQPSAAAVAAAALATGSTAVATGETLQKEMEENNAKLQQELDAMLKQKEREVALKQKLLEVRLQLGQLTGTGSDTQARGHPLRI